VMFVQGILRAGHSLLCLYYELLIVANTQVLLHNSTRCLGSLLN